MKIKGYQAILILKTKNQSNTNLGGTSCILNLAKALVRFKLGWVDCTHMCTHREPPQKKKKKNCNDFSTGVYHEKL